MAAALGFVSVASRGCPLTRRRHFGQGAAASLSRAAAVAVPAQMLGGLALLGAARQAGARVCLRCVAEAPSRQRRRRRRQPSAVTEQTGLVSDQLSLNTCDCELILDTVLEMDLLTPEESLVLCDAARVTAERSGWGAQSHDNHATKDVKIRNLISSAAIAIFEKKVAEPMMEAITEHYQIPRKLLRVEDAFIVRYAIDSQTSLGYHRDGSLVSAIVTLSNPKDFVGGGTAFRDGSLYKPEQGSGIVFAGQRLHCGCEITKGARYILTIFFQCGSLSCRAEAVQRDKEDDKERRDSEGGPGVWGGIADMLGLTM
eukprot:TRINITY_DN17355_c0_g1_i2.p1 TRINITY_DN17355_c0_g1~~TRINITY_DN17355_c0_g1_i2.p1  ORF type:complete len:314 (-),score=54.63 TRINITY_DN17355_c0_g1_i2:46-987(-)